MMKKIISLAGIFLMLLVFVAVLQSERINARQIQQESENEEAQQITVNPQYFKVTTTPLYDEQGDFAGETYEIINENPKDFYNTGHEMVQEPEDIDYGVFSGDVVKYQVIPLYDEQGNFVGEEYKRLDEGVIQGSEE